MRRSCASIVPGEFRHGLLALRLAAAAAGAAAIPAHRSPVAAAALTAVAASDAAALSPGKHQWLQRRNDVRRPRFLQLGVLLPRRGGRVVLAGGDEHGDEPIFIDSDADAVQELLSYMRSGTLLLPQPISININKKNIYHKKYGLV